MQNLLGYLRYSLRQFRQSPVFTGAAILTLALGIGGTTAIFTLIHEVMLRSLPVNDPGSLYRIGEGDDCCVEGGPQEKWGLVSYPLYQRLLNETPEFEQVTAFQAHAPQISVRREKVESVAHPMRSEFVSGNYFQVLGVGAFGGRVFTPEDDKPASAPVAVLSHHVWQETYGRDPSVIGSTLMVEGHPYSVIGVAPPGFFGETLRGDPPDLWLPVNQEPVINGDTSLLKQPISAWLRVIGRLKPGATTDGMSARLTGVLRLWLEHDSGYPPEWMDDIKKALPKQFLNVVPAGAGVAVMKEEYGRSLQILLAVCGMVLLIACANVANLLLARGVARRGQTAVRLALGASRRQTIMQALAESVLLSIAGALAGLVVAFGAARLLLLLAFQSTKFLPIHVWPSWPVMGFAFLMALLTGMIFGSAPAWFATRTDPADALRGSGRGTSDRSSFARKALLLVQATLSVVLVAGATMLARSLNKLENQNFGFSVENRVAIELRRPPATYSRAQLDSLYLRLEERLARLPGVQGAGLAMYNPLTDNWGEAIMVEGHAKGKITDDLGSSWDRVSTNYLQNAGVALVRGRYFNDGDNDQSELVAVVNQAFVKKFFASHEEPLDHHFGIDLPELAGTFRIVGIVGDAKFAGFGLSRPARPTFFVPLKQYVPYKHPLMARLELSSHFIGGIMLATNATAGAMEPVVTRALAEVDPNLTILRVQTVRDEVASSFEEERAVASLAGLFGLVALLLAAIGLYGVTAYTVAQRTQEIGIRMALGADRRSVVKMVLAGASKRVLLGLLVGIPLAIGAGKLISSRLYGVTSWDPMALGVAAIALAISAFFAAIIPAGRAASISPMTALRNE